MYRLTLLFSIFYINVMGCHSYVKIYGLKENVLYSNIKSAATWKNAKKGCESEGATLLIPENREEIDIVHNFFTNSERTGAELWIWAGIYRELDEFYTVDGRFMRDVYHEWSAGEPNRARSAENCLNLYHNKQYNDYFCDKKLPYICKIVLPPISTLPPTYQTMTTPKIDQTTPESYLSTLTPSKQYPSTTSKSTQTNPPPTNQTMTTPKTDQTTPESYLSTLTPSKQSTTSKSTQTTPPPTNQTMTTPKPYKFSTPTITSKTYLSTTTTPKAYPNTIFTTRMDLNSTVPNTTDTYPKMITPCNDKCYLKGSSVCSLSRGVVDSVSKSHNYFGNLIADELEKFPTNEKHQVMIEIMKIIQEQWAKVQANCAGHQ